MTRLGPKQLALLRTVGTSSALVVASATSRRLCALGLMRAHGTDGSFAAITPAGLRALADAVEAGRVEMFQMPEREARDA
ncbi:hypothetical protein [Thauera sp.]|uniref:hypothetical protein n=1 Tax=Thauera sp. TaxID=1905334 RepID=UPI002CA62956|nr:hypothetical protein [Thauera sp.]HRP26369.1 hypothetical protein [Thauera sp.]